MSVRVLVVDDSSFFRRRITEILSEDPDIEVIGQAADGQQGVEQNLALKPDVITMDIEMPVLDGISAVRQIMSSRPTSVMMFSSLTHEGASCTLDALEAGAADFMAKRFEDVAGQVCSAKLMFRQKVRALGVSSHSSKRRKSDQPEPDSLTLVESTQDKTVAAQSHRQAIKSDAQHYKLVVIGASTGGPVAVQKVVEQLPADFPLPVLVIQHMPGTFTSIFADRMDKACKVRVKLAEDGDSLQSGTVYVAPGGKQMLVKRNGVGGRIYITDANTEMNYKPSLDITFRSLATSHKANDILAIVLTGMGSDGCEGARELKKLGATVWVQDKKSCVVYGMPAAIVNAGLADEILPVDEIGRHIGESV